MAPLVGGVSATGGGAGALTVGGGIGGALGTALNYAAPGIGSALGNLANQATQPAPYQVQATTYAPQAAYTPPAIVYQPYTVEQAAPVNAYATANATANVVMPEQEQAPSAVPQLQQPVMQLAGLPPVVPMGFPQAPTPAQPTPMTPMLSTGPVFAPSSFGGEGDHETQPAPTRVTRQVPEVSANQDRTMRPTRVSRRGGGPLLDPNPQSTGQPAQAPAKTAAAPANNPIASLPADDPRVIMARQYHDYMMGQQEGVQGAQNDGYYPNQGQQDQYPGAPPHPVNYFPQLYGQPPQIGPQGKLGKALTAVARGISPRFDKQYGQYQAGLAEQQKTQFEQSNMNWRQASMNDTQIKIEQMKQAAQGKLTLSQILDQVGKIRELPPGSVQRQDAVAALAQMTQSNGYTLDDFKHLIDEPWDEKKIAETRKAKLEAAKSAQDLFEQMQTQTARLAGTNAVESGKVRTEAEQQVLEPSYIAGQTAKNMGDALDYQKKNATYADQVQQEALETQAKQLGLIRSAEELQKFRMDYALDPVKTMLSIQEAARKTTETAMFTGDPQMKAQAAALNNMSGQIAQQQPLQGYAQASAETNAPRQPGMQAYINAVRGMQPPPNGLIPPPPAGMVPTGAINQYPPSFNQVPMPQQQPQPQMQMQQPQGQPPVQAQAPGQPQQGQIDWNRVGPALNQSVSDSIMGPLMSAVARYGPGVVQRIQQVMSQVGNPNSEFGQIVAPIVARDQAARKEAVEREFIGLVNSIPNRNLMTPQSRGLQRGAVLSDPDIAFEFAARAGTANNFNRLVKTFGWSSFEKTGKPQPLLPQFAPKQPALPGSPGNGPAPGQSTQDVMNAWFRPNQNTPLPGSPGYGPQPAMVNAGQAR